jgi:site-specific recombinase XerD
MSSSPRSAASWPSTYPTSGVAARDTIRSYRHALNLFVGYLRTTRSLAVADIDFPGIDRHVVIEFLDWLQRERGCADRTRNQRLMALRSFFSYAGFLDCAHVALSLELAAVPTKNSPGKIVEVLAEAALQALLQQPDTTTTAGRRNQVFMILMYNSAARCGELTGLRVRDLRLDTTHPVVYLHGKGGKTRIVPLLARTAEHCRQHLRRCHGDEPAGSDAFVFFTTIHGQRQPMSTDTVAAFLNAYGQSARTTCPEMPKRFHPHMLRHTRAMHLYRQGSRDLLGCSEGHFRCAVGRVLKSGAGVSVVVGSDAKVKAVIGSIAEDVWTTVEYAGAVNDEQTSRLRLDVTSAGQPVSPWRDDLPPIGTAVGTGGDMGHTTRIPPAEITGVKGALIKRMIEKKLGKVPTAVGVY